MSNNKQCQFEPSTNTSSATICKWCGQEKWQHNTIMSNNKQSMKLYTKEQLEKYIFDEGFIEIHDLANDLIPSIELPSDEDIDRESEVLYPINKGGSMWIPSRYDIDKKNRQEGFLECAKWMRDKIGGNK